MTEVSKKDYNKYDGHARVANNNGVLTRELGGSYVKGKEYTGKIGDATVNGKKEDKTSANMNVVATKDGTKASAEVQQSTTYSGSAEVGNNKIDGSAGKTETVRASSNVDKNSASVSASYDEKYHASANAKIRDTEVNAEGQFTSKTAGDASVKLDKNGLDAKANVVKDFGAKTSLKVDGKEVVKVDASAGAGANAGISLNKNEIKAEAGANAHANADVKVGHIEIKFGIKIDLKFEFGIDLKNGIHFDVKGGIHPNVDFKNTETGKEFHFLTAPNGALAYVRNGKVYIYDYGIVKRRRRRPKVLGHMYSQPLRHSH